MSLTRRTTRYFWLLGILLLVGTLLGAGWVLNHAPAGDASAQTPTSARPAGPDSIIAIGYVNVETGLIPLHPIQPGRVSHVYVAEGDEVFEGQLLMSVDNRVALAELREATAALGESQAQLTKVKMLQGLQKDKMAQQEAAVEASRHNAKAQAQQIAYYKRLFEQKQITIEEFRGHEEKGKALDALVRVEEGKLHELKAFDFGPDLTRAEKDVEYKKAIVQKAHAALDGYDVYAPGAGTILRLSVNAGESVGREPKQPAMLFCPDLPRIVRAEVLQEFAGRVEPGQSAIVEDDTRAGPQWAGRVVQVSDWFTQRRHRLLEPFQFNDVRTLECLVSVNANDRKLRIGQRVRVIIKQGGP